MNSKRYLTGIAIVGLLGWLALGITLLRLDPFTSTALALPFFFIALFLALTGTLGVIGFYLRVWFRHGEIYVSHISIALRQAILISLATSLAMVFQILRILTWWDGLLIVAAISLIEVYFSSND